MTAQPDPQANTLNVVAETPGGFGVAAALIGNPNKQLRNQRQLFLGLLKRRLPTIATLFVQSTRPQPRCSRTTGGDRKSP